MAQPSGMPLIVLTGGPSAGKTAVIEMIRRMVCPHVAVLPESASILFGGGFWRLRSHSASKAAQRAIYHVQNELERMVIGETAYTAAICDRGTLDGLAYWPDNDEDYLLQLNIDREREISKYKLVIHLRTPKPGEYNYSNPLRIESPEEAIQIDKRIERAWNGHPRRLFVNNHEQFINKANEAMRLILSELPPCCATQKANRDLLG